VLLAHLPLDNSKIGRGCKQLFPENMILGE